jgi:hypothetical protein
VLLYSGLEDRTDHLPAGANRLFSVSGDAELVTIEAADYYGNLLTTEINRVSLPEHYCLHQNVPNPFNPITRIQFELPTVSEWSLDIYNVAGQLIESFSGADRGVVTVEWNGINVASGVYFYRLTAGAFSDSRKMVLMK